MDRALIDDLLLFRHDPTFLSEQATQNLYDRVNLQRRATRNPRLVPVLRAISARIQARLDDIEAQYRCDICQGDTRIGDHWIQRGPAFWICDARVEVALWRSDARYDERNG